MATLQEPEIQFAQRLASNEKPVRSKAIKKLKKYIIVRSHKSKGEFSSDELLKLWKGLFYCLWMQDKPLLQEELSNQISGLFHCFQSADDQFLYLEAFLQTVKREWTGIDRLRMDKFYQLVRFVFRQTFEMLKKREWEASFVNRFLEMVTSQVLQGNGTAPSGLQYHILDLYLTELARVGSVELSADQNLTLIVPFCKIVAKTKDNTLFKAICNSIFSTIIDQAPFAIEDLFREMKSTEHSEEEEEEEEEEVVVEEEMMKCQPVRKKSKKKPKGKLLNGTKSKVAENDDEDEDDNQSLEDSDTELPDDDGSEPVLQFDYAALADKLFEFASRGNAPSHNRQRLYKIIKILRDLSEGVFPQDDYPEEVSTDEDDEMFGSRKRMKRKSSRHADEEEEEEEEVPAAKKKKKSGKKTEKSNNGENNKNSVKDDEEPTKKRKKKKAGKEGGDADVAEAEVETQAVTEDQLEQSPPMVEAADQSEPQPTGESDSESLKTLSKRRKKGKKSITVVEPTSQAGEQPPAAAPAAAPQEEDGSVGTAEPGGAPAVEPATSTNLKGKKKNKCLFVEAVAEEAEATPTPLDETAADLTADSVETKSPKKRNRRRSRKPLTTLDPVKEAQAPTESAETPILDATAETTETTTPANKKKQKGSRAAVRVQGTAESVAVCDPKQPAKDLLTPKKIKKNANKQEAESPADDVIDVVMPAPQRKNKKARVTKEAFEPTEVELSPDQTPPLVAVATPASKKKLKKASAAEEAKEDTAVQETPATPLSQKKVQKKRKIPVVFEFEAEELEAAARLNGLASKETLVTSPKKTKLQNGAVEIPSTSLSSTKSPGKKPKNPGKALISFQKTSVPTPLFFKTKGTPGTPRSKKPQTPKSETKKVTFGLKNNKTAEFRKSDRSLLLSPEGPSRVPFDPTQKPKFGVLKSPGPASLVFRKTPKPSKKTPNGTPKLRPTADDFF